MLTLLYTMLACVVRDSKIGVIIIVNIVKVHIVNI